MNTIQLSFGNVTEKKIVTENHFVSHMIEHIAWRLGMKINLEWKGEDWKSLGIALGQEIAKNPIQQRSGVALGMIDDGTAEVLIEQDNIANFVINSTENVDLDWFFNLRCEQLSSGFPLIELLKGVAEGIKAKISVQVCNVEDAHHTWEGIFRGIGIALNKMYTPVTKVYTGEVVTEKNCLQGNISILERSLDHAIFMRGTSETGVTVCVDFSCQKPNSFIFNVDPSISTQGLDQLLTLLAQEAGCTLQVTFNAKVFSSSHVVLEDVGMVLGKALLEILKLRMETYGVNGAGSSLQTKDDLEQQGIRIGISVEGRKFWRFVPFTGDYKNLQKKLLIGNNVLECIRSEDLDDFIDGLAGGMSCTIAVHVKELSESTNDWKQIFSGIGKALKETFSINPYRKGVPAGVKATLV